MIDENINELFAAMDTAFQVFAQACQAAWDAIVDALYSVSEIITRIYQQLRTEHLIARQYRNTMPRRKMRRYALYCARRARSNEQRAKR